MIPPVTPPGDPPEAAAAPPPDIADDEPLLQRTRRHALDLQSSDDGQKDRAQLSVAPEAAAAMQPGERLYMVALFTLTAALLYADQNLMAPNLTDIAADFKFDDEQRDRMLGGYIAAAMYLVGAPAALLFGWLSDRVNRKHLLFAAVVLGRLAGLLLIIQKSALA